MIRLVVLGLVLAVAGGCSRPGAADDGVAVAMRVAPEPPAVGLVAVEVRLADADGRPLEAESVAIEGTMAHAGMTPTFAVARTAGPGRWRADLELTMPGDWFVVVDARLADGRRVHRELPLPAVEPR